MTTANVMELSGSQILCNLESLTELIKDREGQACWSGMGPRPLDFCQWLQMIFLLLFFF